MTQMTSKLPWRAHVITIFPEMFPGPLAYSLAGQALESKTWALKALNLRNFADNRHKSVDDTPYGGGSGMVMRPDVVGNAIQKASNSDPDLPLVYLTPRGQQVNQRMVNELARGPGLIVICGRYEGIDSRVMEAFPGQELSVGDYVLSGGEPGAISLFDACVRLLPGVVGDSNSLLEESFEEGLLEYPHYTRPKNWRGLKVPDILISGHHKNIQRWRQNKSKTITQERRPDLWERYLSRHL